MTSKPTPAQRRLRPSNYCTWPGSCYYFTNPAMGQKPPAGGERSEARAIQVQGRHRCVRQEILRRWRNRHPVERRKRPDDGGCLLPLSREARVIDITHTASSSIAENTTGQLVVYYRHRRGLCRRSRGPRSKAQGGVQVPVLISAPFAPMGEDRRFLAKAAHGAG